MLGRIEVEQDWAGAIGKHALPEDVDQYALQWCCHFLGEVLRLAFRPITGILPLQGLSWARRLEKGRRLGPRPKMASDVLQVGDVIAVEAVKKEDKSATSLHDYYSLRQIPEISGAIVVLDPHSGRVLAMSGGFSAVRSLIGQRKLVASRVQPLNLCLSSGTRQRFYAIESGVDAPFVIDQGPGRDAGDQAISSENGESACLIEKSRNLMTVRLAQNIGMETVVDYAKRFNLVDDLQPLLSMALGADDTNETNHRICNVSSLEVKVSSQR